MSKYNKLWLSIIPALLMIAVYVLGKNYGMLPEGFDPLMMGMVQGALSSLSVVLGPANK